MTETVIEVEIPGLERLFTAEEALYRTPKHLLQQALPVLKLIAPVLARLLCEQCDAAVAFRAAKHLGFSINEFAQCLEDLVSALRAGNFDNVAFEHKWIFHRRCA